MEPDLEVSFVIVFRRVRKALAFSLAISIRAALKVAVVLFFNISVPYSILCHIRLSFI
jgi:predicted RND superfamily exporter protein